VVKVLPDSFAGMGSGRLPWIPIVGSRPRCGPQIKDGKSRAKNGAQKRLRCGSVEKEVSQI